MTVELFRDGDTIMALIGPNCQVGIAGYGGTAAQALRSLADALERENWALPELDRARLRPLRIK